MHPDLAAFLNAKSAAGRSLDTIRWYHMFIRQYLDWAEEWKMDNKKPETVEAFLTHLRSRSLSAFTISGCYRALRIYFKWLMSRRRIKRNPMLEVQAPSTPHQRKPHVTEVQFNHLYLSIDGKRWVDARDRCILLILFYSGLRASEIAHLTVEDIDRIHMVLRVNSGKGGRDRDVPFVPALLGAVDDYLDSRPYHRRGNLFLAYNGHQAIKGPLSYEGLKEIMRRRCVAAGIPRLALHSFRHGYAMAFLNAGMPIDALSQSLGHSSIEITRRFYADWQINEMSREYNNALRRLGPVPAQPSDS